MKMNAKAKRRRLRVSPGRLIALGFLSVSLFGALLLCLPVSHSGRVPVSPLDALFSAVPGRPAAVSGVSGTLAAVIACLAADTNDCPRRSACSTLPMWEEYDALIRDFFRSKKLTELARRKQ